MIHIEFTLNGESIALAVDPTDTLLEALRDKAGIKSPKVACDRGDCGACTILLNGKAVRSCLMLAVEADKQTIVTIEGIATDGPTKLQREFVKNNAFQCGFCAPGIVLAAHELLAHTPHPTREEAQEAISGNLCRCTGYEKILKSIVEVNGKETKGGAK
jgi:aerobic-type carbon monoxide dehydrogenase small subunit (CoxS/CutS family)